MSGCQVQSWDNRKPQERLNRPCVDTESGKILKSFERKTLFESLLSDPSGNLKDGAVSLRILDSKKHPVELKKESDGSYKVYLSKKDSGPAFVSGFLAFKNGSGPLNGAIDDTYLSFSAEGVPQNGYVKKGILTGPSADLIGHVKEIDTLLARYQRTK